MLSRFQLLPLCRAILLLHVIIAIVDAERTRHSIDVEELSEVLFPIERHPFAEEDRWPLLTREQREAWTFAHDKVPEFVDEILNPMIASYTNRRFSLLITIKIIASPKTKLNYDKLTRYARLVQTKGKLSEIEFRLSHPKAELYTHITSASGADVPQQISLLLHHDAISTSASDTVYIIIADEKDSLSKLASHPPFIAADRVFWYVHSVDATDDVNVAQMLVRASAIAQKLYDPPPKFFPVPVSATLRVEISAYTPRYYEEAPWVKSFPWSNFEKTVRNLALVGQTVGFFMNPVNKDCTKCSDAFQSALKATTPSSEKRVLHAWKNEQKDYIDIKDEQARGADDDPNSVFTVSVLVVDTSKLPDSPVTERLERNGISSIQGASMIVVRSSRSDSPVRLQSLLLQGILESAFGISNSRRYIYGSTSNSSTASFGIGNKISMVLFDNIVRNAVSSSVHNTLSALDIIVESMKQNDVVAAKVLADDDYASLLQRTNLLFYKLKHSQLALSDEHNAGKALHMAAATFHDLQSIQSMFHIVSGKKSSVRAHFRDSRTKCRFSKIQERAISASELFEGQASMLTRTLFVAIAFILGLLLGRALSLIKSRMKYAVKRE